MSSGSTGYVVGDVYLDTWDDVSLSLDLPIPCVLVDIEGNGVMGTWLTFLWSTGAVQAVCDIEGDFDMVPLDSLS